MDIGIDSFAAILPEPATGKLPSATDRMADLLDEVEVADRVGLDVFGIGEHHLAEFLDSAPAIILAAAAARTKRIRLTSAVTVLSAADPVRVAASKTLGGISRITFQMSTASLETTAMKRSIELRGTEVAPRIRAATAKH